MRRVQRFLSVLLPVLIGGPAHAEDQRIPPAMQSLVETERAFARMSVEKGFQQAVAAFFAGDSVNYEAYPDRRPKPNAPPAPRPPRTGTWTPMYGDVSRSGELGFLLGPFLVTDQSDQHRPPKHGVFFTIWRRRGDVWRVELDFGINTPRAYAPIDTPFAFAGEGKPVARPRDANGEPELAGLLRRDHVPSLPRQLASDVRLHREGQMPVVGKAAVEAWLKANPAAIPAEIIGEPLSGSVAASGDLAFTYGTYELNGETGMYVHVWKRSGQEDWKVVVDAMQPAPPNVLDELVEAERAFARDGVMLGQRAAWLRWFDSSGVLFRPRAINAHATMSDPAQSALPPGALFWQPAYGDVSLSGDLGYSTGPVLARDPSNPSAPPRQSDFFSIWRRDESGAWKVVLDLGARVPQDADVAARWRARFKRARIIKPERLDPATVEDLLKLDAELNRDAGAMYLDDARGLRWDLAPLAGRDAIVAADAAHPAVTARIASGGGLSRAADLGYTYGVWERGKENHGVYARVWKRDRAGAWKIAFDVERPE
ncbi:MAG TPA: hypothetical protein VKB93_03440 [Thermoanaerobaculia bacterium]|nr:hypothetical protein [Thermoanaerobaculia bacterium]